MLKTIIKPMINHTITNVNSIDSLEDSLFPLCFTPFVKGIQISIQKGHIFLTFNGSRINNAELIEILRPIREKTLRSGYVVSGTLACENYNENKLLTDVMSTYGELPHNMEIHINDVVVDQYIDKMNREQRDANMYAIGLVNGVPNAKYHQHTVAKDLEELKNLVAPHLFNKVISGITIHKPNGKYTTGFNNDNLDSINIDCSRVVTGEIVGVEGIIRYVGKREVPINILGKVKIQLPNGIVIERALSNDSSLEERLTMWNNRGVLTNAPIQVEINEIPSFRRPIIKRIISIC